MVTTSPADYKTADTILATYLVLSDFTLLDIIYRGQQGFFVFANDNGHLAEAVRSFELMQARVEPGRFLKTYQSMIDRVLGRIGGNRER